MHDVCVRLTQLLPMLSQRLATFQLQTLLATPARHAALSARPFTTLRLGFRQASLAKQPSRSGFRNRTFMTDRIVQESKPMSWKHIAIIAGGVAGVAVVTDGFLNRQTRDPLSTAEKSLLNDTFKYTGTGLLLTALAARSMFRSGFAFRVMSANPCECSANE